MGGNYFYKQSIGAQLGLAFDNREAGVVYVYVYEI